MAAQYDRRETPAQILFKNLFHAHPPDMRFERVAAGIRGCHKNADRLLSDIRLLFGAGRLSSARFLIATAREEIAKAYILADACRLDFSKHESALCALCRAFYDHVRKHAYLAVLDGPSIQSLRDAEEAWKLEVRELWKGDLDSGEPDMPHATRLEREFPLYVDFIHADQQWSIPENSSQAAHFEEMMGMSRLSEVERLIEPWRSAVADGVVSPEVLSIMNDVFKRVYLSSSSTSEQVRELYRAAAARVGAETSVSAERFLSSPLFRWPLYSCAEHVKALPE